MRYGRDESAEPADLTTLVRGAGRFTDDLVLPGQAYGAFVRAPVANAALRGVDTTAARAFPGVLAVLTGEDVAAAGLDGIPPAVVFKGRGGAEMRATRAPVLAQDRVRYVGEPLALVVAETPAAALDAAELVVPDYAEEPAAPDIDAALAPGAPVVWPAAPDNLALDWEDGDAAALDAVFAGAAHVERIALDDPRVAPAPMEPRAAIAEWDPATDRYTLTATTQGVAIVRKLLAEQVFRMPPEQLRVRTFEVGGGFGMKAHTYPEYAALLLAARRIARPVKWQSNRLESFLSDTHGRDHALSGEMAFDRDWRILGLRATSLIGIGPYTTTFAAIFTTNNTKNCLSSVYAIPRIYMRARLVFTHAAPLGPYRGAGRPEAIYLIERLLDRAAASAGLDRVEIRRRNLIPPAAMPYRAANAMIYDSGDFATVLDRALHAADWAGFPARRAASAAAGRLRGIGIGCFLEVAGGILDEAAELRFGEDDTVALHTGAQAIGQGHAGTFPALIAARLGIDVARVRLVAGDSDRVPAGTPTVASRSIMMGGSAAALACDEALRRGAAVAAHLLEAAAADIEYEAGRFRIAGTDRALTLFEVASRARALPAEAGLPPALDNRAQFVSPQMSFPNGCHVCEVEIDPETGVVTVLRYVAVDDVGRILDMPVVEGQIHGGALQGLGQVLGERIVYDARGQLLTGSFMDYPMPRAADAPVMTVLHHVTECTTNPLGVKGAGESGVAGALPSAVGAIHDALAPCGVAHLDMPFTPERVWRAIRAARAG